MTLDTMGVADLEAVCQVDGQSFDFSWPRHYFESELSLSEAHCLVARHQKQGAGVEIGAYSCIRILVDEMHLMRLAVDPQYRGKGMGLWILEATCAMAGALGAESALLEVRESNAAAVALYEKAGFTCCGRRPNYYSETREAALVMQKKIPRRHYDHENRNQRLWPDRASSLPGRFSQSFSGSGGNQ
ncbi:MAG: ribosomal protein S18-alanine N-acetyltransferase [Desulfatibacillum sp.]|nr:ribosomal protein S18-alanine N-acetyltransferase [Desulfatibacillum sp.]